MIIFIKILFSFGRFEFMLSYLMHKKYDMVIIGAGINGVAIAKALAMLGKQVLVVEKSHISAGASSNSSRLIHGGLRYLENFEFSLVKEALHDQKYLLDSYPDLVKLRPFYLPIYKNSKRPVWMIRMGLWLYGFFAQHGRRPIEVEKKHFLAEFAHIKEDNLKTVFRYFDGKTDDDALTHKIASEAEAAGAKILEHTQIASLQVKDEAIALRINDTHIHTQVLINATGAWVDEVNEEFNLPSSYTIEKLSGIHLLIGKILVPEPLILETSTKRIFFMIPETDSTLIGTTERSESCKVDEIKIHNDDIEYLLRESNAYLKTELKRDDIKEVFIGTRPIIKSKKDVSKMSREYKLDLHPLGNHKVLHIYGGKLTTFPSLAKKVLDILTD